MKLQNVQAVIPAGWDQMTQKCQQKLFPIGAGGSSDEYVTCTIYDQVNNQIIVTGNSTSPNWVPAANNHAFAYAVDLQGNWVWGKFFYNVSYAVATISGCQLNQFNNLVVFGTGNSQPVIMELNLKDGSVLKFVSIELIGTSSTNQPWFMTYGGLYHETNTVNQTQYYYASFVMNDMIQVLKINDQPDTSYTPSQYNIVWNYQFNYTGVVGYVWQNRKSPRFLTMDQTDPNKMFLIGRLFNCASITKFRKTDFTRDWRLEINGGSWNVSNVWTSQQCETNVSPTNSSFAPNTVMGEITSYVQPPNQQYIYACGYSFTTPDSESTGKTASLVKFSTVDGTVEYLYSWGTQGYPTALNESNVCRQLTYDSVNNQVIIMLETTSSNLRPQYNQYAQWSANNSDILIMIMQDSGLLLNGYNINNQAAAVSWFLGDHSALSLNNYIVFGGYSQGFYTKYQNQTYSLTTSNLDTYLFMYDVSQGSNCFYTSYLPKATLASITNKIPTSGSNSSVFLGPGTFPNYYWQAITQFIAYDSRYSAGFDLLDTFKYPKMCASQSVNLTNGVTFYRAQWKYGYQIGQQSNASQVLNQMDRGYTWLFQNGSLAENKIGTLDRYTAGGTVYIQTNSEDAVGQQRTIIRGCSAFDELLEIYLYILVVANTYPDFATQVETSWTLSVGDVFQYQLPGVVDKGGDSSQVYVDYMAGQAFPPFLNYINDTMTLEFRPDSIWYKGNTYHFAIVVKQTHSDILLYPYYCSVNINGNQLNPLTDLNFTDVYFNLTKIDRYSTGSIVFTKPINLTFVQQYWDQIFNVYINNVTFRDSNLSYPVQLIEFTNLSADNKTMNFTATFDSPYMLGLLVKRSDRLYVAVKYDRLDVFGFFKPQFKYLNGMFFGNVSEQRFMPSYCLADQANDASNPYGDTTNREQMSQYAQIPLQFDYRNQFMFYWREYAKKCYWYLIGVIGFQALALQFRNVGLLPVWTLIEYMQLAAFLPLYNFRLIPYLYDVFKPFLISHLILTNDVYFMEDMAYEYPNINYDYFGVSIGKMGQGLALMACLFAILVGINIIVFILWLLASKESSFGQWIGGVLSQFKFNVYIRYYMLVYFDISFFAIMKLVEGDVSTYNKNIAFIASYAFFTLNIVVPVFLISLVCKRFEVMKIKQAKANFNTVILKIDKQSRCRLLVPAFFFIRRMLTALLLSIPTDNTFIFLQYVFVLMSSHAYVLYLVSVKPYQTLLMNNFVLANETFYSALIIAIFIFSDATPELYIKFAAGVVLISSTFLLLFANFLMVIIMLFKGRDKLKEEIKQAKLKRAEEELMEEEEEEERLQKEKREEEEFVRVPEDTAAVTQYDLKTSAAGETTQGDADGKKDKKKKRKNKKVNDNDDVNEFTQNASSQHNNTSAMGNTTSMMNDTNEPLRESDAKKDKKDKKKKKRRDKNKNKNDDVNEIDLNGPEEDEFEHNHETSDKKLVGNKTKGSTDDPSGSSSSDQKKGKKGKKNNQNDEDDHHNDKNLM